MKLGALTVPLYDRSAEDAFYWLHTRGVEAVELGTGGFPGNTHCNPGELLTSQARLSRFSDLLKKHSLTISALSCHSNHLHPNEAVRKQAADDLTATFKLAEKLQVRTVVTFSGCPGDHDGAKHPNWVACAWPSYFQEILDYQWNGALIPFWAETVKEAEAHGVQKIALEMHPGFCVYNPETLLKLRKAVGPVIGATFDPSHLFWQGIDPTAAVFSMAEAIYHFHAKDTKIDARNSSVNGRVDTKSLSDIKNRSWLFRSVGYGNDSSVWKDIFSALQAVGYDGAISIEHEDALMSAEEGLQKAICFLREIIISEKPMDNIFWA